LWIVLGGIFAGAVHDYLSGMISLRNGGANVPALVLKNQGAVIDDDSSFFVYTIQKIKY